MNDDRTQYSTALPDSEGYWWNLFHVPSRNHPRGGIWFEGIRTIELYSNGVVRVVLLGEDGTEEWIVEEESPDMFWAKAVPPQRPPEAQ
jgi:hypothetical protein